MKNRTIVKLATATIAAMACATALAEVRVWKFDVGSGCWSNPDNWENGVPVAGDSVRITNEVSNAVITNDLGAMSLGSLNIYGSQAVTFGSPKLTLSGGLTMRNASIINCDLHITANFSLRCGDRPNSVKEFPQATCEPTFNGDITVADGKILYITGDSGAQFNGTLTGKKAELKNGTINWSSGQFYFNKPVWFKEIAHYSADQSTFWFNAAGNKYEKFTADYSNYYFLVPGAMDPDGVISFSNAGGDSNAIYKGYYLRADQTINRFGECTDPGSKDRHYFTANGAGKHIEVVARGTADGSSYVRMLDNMGFTWAPTGDFTQEFLNRTHTITGPLVVSNGTIKMSGTCSFKQVSKITVKANAKFHHASTETAALNNVTQVVLEDGATFKVDSGASNPFTKSPLFTMGQNAKIEVAEGATMSVGAVFLNDGTLPSSGTYTGTGATGTPATWVTGAGTVVVTTSGLAVWKQAASGDFNVAANWNDGVLPAAGTVTYITAKGADYTVSLDAAPASFAGGLRLSNDGVHTNVLAVSAAATFTNESVEVSAGGRIEVNDGGTFTFRSSSSYGKNALAFTVRDGGSVEVNGGYLNISRMLGKMALSGTAGNEGVLAIRSGTCRIHSDYAGDGLWIHPGGRLVMDGGTLDLRLYTNKYSPLTMAGGVMEVGGDAVVLIGGGIGFYFGEGTANFAGNAQLSYSDTIARLAICARNPNDVARVEFTGNSALKLNGAIATYVGYENPAGAKSILRQASSATSEVGAICGVGERNGYGEIDVESGRLHVGSYGLSIASNIHDSNAPDGVRPEGVVKVSGGILSIDGSAAGVNQGRPSYGLVVGDGMAVSNGVASTSLHKGTLEITGGVVSNHAGLVSVGIGKAKGFVRQTGGTFISKTLGRATTIGSFGGEGEWTMDGGTASVPGNLFVGGCEISDWNKTSSDPMYNVTSGSYGRLSITNGTFSVGWYAYVGKNGTGLVEVGTGGVFQVGGNIDVRAGGTLKFVFGPEGAGRIQANAGLLVDENAKLVLDVSAYGTKPGRHKLIRAEGVLGQFDPENVEFIGKRESMRAVIEYRNRELVCSLGSGFVMLVR